MSIRHPSDDSPLNKRILNVLGLDVRSMAATRILLGGILLYDLAVRAFNLSAHYTDAGVFPRALVTVFDRPAILSLHMLSGEAGLQIVLFVLAGISAGMLLLGYRTRWATAACWFLTLSLHLRNPAILNLGDNLLLLLLFWGMWLPWGERWSLDTTKRKAGIGRSTVFSIATFALVLQLAAVYWFSYLFKDHPIWHDGEAIYYTLSLDRFVKGAGEWMLTWPPAWLNGLSKGVLYLELLGPFLLFIPWKTTTCRLIAVGLFWSLHAGFGLTLALGIFPAVCIAAWMLIVPSAFWDRLATRFSRLRSEPIGSMPALRLGSTLLGVLVIWYMAASNMASSNQMGEAFYQSVFRYVEPIGEAIGIDQQWNMFSPHPPTRDGWFVLYAMLADGTQVDLHRPGRDEGFWVQPVNVRKTYRNQRWRKYLEWTMNQAKRYAPEWVRFEAAEWDRRHPLEKQVVWVDVYFMFEPTQPDYQRVAPARRFLYTWDKRAVTR